MFFWRDKRLYLGGIKVTGGSIYEGVIRLWIMRQSFSDPFKTQQLVSALDPKREVLMKPCSFRWNSCAEINVDSRRTKVVRKSLEDCPPKEKFATSLTALTLVKG